MLFPVGKLHATSAALATIVAAGEHPLCLVARHSHGDWGDLCDEDRRENDWSVDKHLRLLSSYRLTTGKRVWVITEADRSMTTVLTPDEY